jgi:hypothetical protein
MVATSSTHEFVGCVVINYHICLFVARIMTHSS